MNEHVCCCVATVCTVYERREFGGPEIELMANHFSSLLTSEELALVPAQWRQLKRLISSKYRMRSYQDVYSQLISTRMDDENLGAVVNPCR